MRGEIQMGQVIICKTIDDRRTRRGRILLNLLALLVGVVSTAILFSIDDILLGRLDYPTARAEGIAIEQRVADSDGVVLAYYVGTVAPRAESLYIFWGDAEYSCIATRYSFSRCPYKNWRASGTLKSQVGTCLRVLCFNDSLQSMTFYGGFVMVEGHSGYVYILRLVPAD